MYNKFGSSSVASPESEHAVRALQEVGCREKRRQRFSLFALIMNHQARNRVGSELFFDNAQHLRADAAIALALEHTEAFYGVILAAPGDYAQTD